MIHTIFRHLILALLLLLLSAVAASAFGEIRYPDRALNLRDGRSPSARWVGSLVTGQEVRVAFLEKGWVAVFEPGETRNSIDAAVGYANLKYLKTTRHGSAKVDWGREMESAGSATLRSGASALKEAIGTLEAGQKVIADFPEDDWFMVFPASATVRSEMGALGYVKKSDLRPVSKSVAKPTTTPSISKRAMNDKRDVYTDWGKPMVLKAPVKIYRERSTNSRLESTLGPGKRVRVDFLADGWYAVFEEGERLRKEYRAIGYASSESLEKSETQIVTLSETIAAATGTSQSEAKPSQQRVVIDKSRMNDANRPDPKPNKTAHGYKYKLMKKGQAKKQGETWITLKVFLATSKLPSQEALEDFATTLWKEHRRLSKNLAVLIYLPGQDTNGISYGVVQFSDKKLLETWVRRTTLLGTKFL